jgi:hypothetical protein
MFVTLPVVDGGRYGEGHTRAGCGGGVVAGKGGASGKIIRVAIQFLRKTRVRKPRAATVTIRYKSFMPKKQFERKVRALQRLGSEGKLYKASNPVLRDRKVAADYKNRVIQRIHRMYHQKDPAGTRALIDKVRKMHPDHVHELQLGGPDTARNLRMLDAWTNVDIGTQQIWPQIRNLPDGTAIKIKVRR